MLQDTEAENGRGSSTEIILEGVPENFQTGVELFEEKNGRPQTWQLLESPAKTP